MSLADHSCFRYSSKPHNSFDWQRNLARRRSGILGACLFSSSWSCLHKLGNLSHLIGFSFIGVYLCQYTARQGSIHSLPLHNGTFRSCDRFCDHLPSGLFGDLFPTSTMFLIGEVTTNWLHISSAETLT